MFEVYKKCWKLLKGRLKIFLDSYYRQHINIKIWKKHINLLTNKKLITLVMAKKKNVSQEIYNNLYNITTVYILKAKCR